MAAADLGSALATGAAGWLLTYLLYSSVALGVVWVLVRMSWVESPTARDTLWKTALVVGLLTASVRTGTEHLEQASLRAARQQQQEVEVHRIVRGVPGGGPIALPVAMTELRERTEKARGSASAAMGGDGPSGQRIQVTAHISDPSAECRAALRSGAEGLGSRLGPGAGGLSARLQAAGTACESGPLSRWYWAVLPLWALGAVIGLVRLLSGYMALRTAVAGRREVRPGRLRSLLAELVADTSCAGPVRLTISDGLDSPAVLGRREICLPPRTLELSEQEMRVVLAHELGHLSRRDPLWAGIVATVETLFFLQPLNRLARKELQDASEFLCDDWAVERTGTPLVLARSLARVSGWLTGQAPEPALGMVRRTDGRLVRRVERILEDSADRPRTPRWLMALSAVLFLAVAAIPPVSVRPPNRIRVETSMDGAGPADLDLLALELRANPTPGAYIVVLTEGPAEAP